MVGDVLTPEIVSACAAQLLKRRIAEREEINRNHGLGKSQMARLVPTETGVVMVDVETPDDPR